MSRTSEFFRAIRGPVTLIALGTLFMLDYFCGKPFYRTWPFLLIVNGTIWLFERLSANASTPSDGGSV